MNFTKRHDLAGKVRARARRAPPAPLWRENVDETNGCVFCQEPCGSSAAVARGTCDACEGVTREQTAIEETARQDAQRRDE